MHPRQVRLGRTGPPAVHLTLRRPGGASLVLDGGLPPVAGVPRLTVEGQPEHLALLLWGRLAADSPAVTVTADEPDAVAHLAALLATPLTP
ncbi:hypothetical protein [Serinibacter arcticus]|uniref:hypothetical protein n=1 Tax=Serinibacter arcticus TaxID=1655435 RepID=UPI003AF32A72